MKIKILPVVAFVVLASSGAQAQVAQPVCTNNLPPITRMTQATTVQNQLTNFQTLATPVGGTANHPDRYELCYPANSTPLSVNSPLTVNKISDIPLYIVGLSVKSGQNIQVLNVSGSNIFLWSIIITGTASERNNQPTCLAISNASNVQILSSEFSNCSEGIRVEESNNIYIGHKPEEAYVESQVNKIHDNGVGVHIVSGTKIFAKHNSFWSNQDNNSITTPNVDGILIDNEVINPSLSLLNDDNNFIRYPEGMTTVSADCNHPTAGEIWVQAPSITGTLEMLFTDSIDKTWSQGKEFLEEFATTPDVQDYNASIVVHLPFNMCQERLNRFVTFIFHSNDYGSSSFSVSARKLNGPSVVSVIGMPATPPGAVDSSSGGASDGGSGSASAGGSSGGNEESAGQGPTIETATPRTLGSGSAGGDVASSQTGASSAGDTASGGFNPVTGAVGAAGGCGGGGTIAPTQNKQVSLVWICLALPLIAFSFKRRQISQ